MAKADVTNEVHALEIYRDQMKKELDSAAEWKKNWGFLAEKPAAPPRGFCEISVKYASKGGTYTNARVCGATLWSTSHALRLGLRVRQQLPLIQLRYPRLQKRVPDNSEEGMAAAMSEQNSRATMSSLSWQVQCSSFCVATSGQANFGFCDRRVTKAALPCLNADKTSDRGETMCGQTRKPLHPRVRERRYERRHGSDGAWIQRTCSIAR